MKVGITGIKGKMGQFMALEVMADNLLDLSSALVRTGYDEVGMDIGEFLGGSKINSFITDDVGELFAKSDVVVDFSSPELTMECARIASNTGKTLISGTTGLTDAELEELKKYANNCVIIWSSNMSVGVNVLKNLVEETAAILRDDFDAEILEMHHRSKKDAPSGTSLSLGKAVADGRGWEFGEVCRKTRDGIIGPRSEKEIGFATLRGGDVVGDHTVIFAGNGERLELTHRASSRLIYVKGAIRAIFWSDTKKTGFYTLQDVLRVAPAGHR